MDELVNLNEYDRLKVKSIKSVFIPRKLRKATTVEVEEDAVKAAIEAQKEQAAEAGESKKLEERNIEVEHSSINFTKVIIGEKIRNI